MYEVRFLVRDEVLGAVKRLLARPGVFNVIDKPLTHAAEVGDGTVKSTAPTTNPSGAILAFLKARKATVISRLELKPILKQAGYSELSLDYALDALKAAHIVRPSAKRGIYNINLGNASKRGKRHGKA